MKLILLTLIFIVCLGIPVRSQQKVLVIRNITSGKERMIPEGKRIKILMNNGDKWEGRLDFRLDSDDPQNPFLLVSGHLIYIQDIKMFQTQSLFAQISGGTFTGIGGLTGFLGYLVLEGSSSQDDPMINAIGLIGFTGGILVGLGGLGLMTLGRKYNPAQWEFQIKSLPMDRGEDLINSGFISDPFDRKGIISQ